jgi:hypothetical protein
MPVLDEDSRDLRGFVPREMILRVHVYPSLALRGGRFPSCLALQVSASPFQKRPKSRIARKFMSFANALHCPGESPGVFPRHRQMQAFADVEGITVRSNKLPSNSC